jgi:hypothetical protein
VDGGGRAGGLAGSRGARCAAACAARRAALKSEGIILPNVYPVFSNFAAAGCGVQGNSARSWLLRPRRRRIAKFVCPLVRLGRARVHTRALGYLF